MFPPHSILAFRNGSIGNTLAAVPALRALRHAYPNAQLTVVVDSAGHDLLTPCPWIDRLIVYDKHGLDRSLVRQFQIIRRLRAARPSHAILFKRFFRNGLLAKLSGAPIRIGFMTNDKAPFLTRTIPYDETISIVALNLRLASLLGASSEDNHLELFLTSEDENAASDFLRAHQIGETYAIAHYGGNTTSPTFVSTARFVDLLDAISPDCNVLQIGHGERERSMAREIQSLSSRYRMATDLPIRVTAALMQRASFFVGFDSGPAHLAAAAGAHTLILYRPSEHAQKQIRKWLPPSPLAYPLIPPATSDDKSWDEFRDSARRILERTLD